jgi:predicted XRE-type DNA-binding protein
MATNLFEDLGFPPEEAAALKLKTDLHTKIVKCAARYSQRQLQAILDESQPRVSDLLRGKMSKFSLEMLVIYAEKLGLHTEIKIKRVRSRVAAAGLALLL